MLKKRCIFIFCRKEKLIFVPIPIDLRLNPLKIPKKYKIKVPKSRRLYWSTKNKLEIFIRRAFQKPLMLNSLTRTKSYFQFCFGIAKVNLCALCVESNVQYSVRSSE